MENPTQKSLFQLLEEANNQNVLSKQPSILGTTQDLVSNTISIFAGSVESIAKGMELANSYISEELDRQVASRTETKVEATIAQLTAIAKLSQLGIAFGATNEEVIKLATSYRR